MYEYPLKYTKVSICYSKPPSLVDVHLSEGWRPQATWESLQLYDSSGDRYRWSILVHTTGGTWGGRWFGKHGSKTVLIWRKECGYYFVQLDLKWQIPGLRELFLCQTDSIEEYHFIYHFNKNFRSYQSQFIPFSFEWTNLWKPLNPLYITGF